MSVSVTVYQKHIDVAERLLAEENWLGALVSYRQAYQLIPSSDPVSSEVELKIYRLEKKVRAEDPEVGGLRSRQLSETHNSSREKNSILDGNPDKKWRPMENVKPRNNLILGLAGGFTLLAVIIFVIVSNSESAVNSVTNNVVTNFGNTGLQVFGAAVVSLLVGLVQVCIFKSRIRNSNRIIYILATTLGGGLGGLAGGLLVSVDFVNGYVVGALIGVVAGLVSSLVQNSIMTSHNSGMKWLGWNIVSWGVIWGISWGLSWGIGGAIGVAAGAAIVLILSGLSLASFLSISKEIEF